MFRKHTEVYLATKLPVNEDSIFSPLWRFLIVLEVYAKLCHTNSFLESISNCSAAAASNFPLDSNPSEEWRMFPRISSLEPGKPQAFPQAERRGCLHPGWIARDRVKNLAVC